MPSRPAGGDTRLMALPPIATSCRLATSCGSITSKAILASAHSTRRKGSMQMRSTSSSFAALSARCKSSGFGTRWFAGGDAALFAVCRAGKKDPAASPRIRLLQCIIMRLVDQALALSKRREEAGVLCQHTLVAERAQHLLHAEDCSLQGGIGVEDEAEAELGGCRPVDDRRPAAQHHVEHLRCLEALRHLGEIGRALRCLDEGHVGAGLDIALGAVDSCVEAFGGAGIGAR